MGGKGVLGFLLKMYHRVLFFTFMFGAYFTPSFAQDPEIAETILPEIKRVGLKGTLRCVVINQQTYPVYWIHKNKALIISKDDKIELDRSLNILDNGQPRYIIERSYEGDNKVRLNNCHLFVGIPINVTF